MQKPTELRYALVGLLIGLAILAYGVWYFVTAGPCGNMGSATLPPSCIWAQQTFPSIVFLSGTIITVLSFLLLRRRTSKPR